MPKLEFHAKKRGQAVRLTRMSLGTGCSRSTNHLGKKKTQNFSKPDACKKVLLLDSVCSTFVPRLILLQDARYMSLLHIFTAHFQPGNPLSTRQTSTPEFSVEIPVYF